jgi:predicted component of type VI protein secretion system
MQARLILNSPDNADRELKLSLPATVGRGRDAKVKLIHGKVSRIHCEFFEQNGVLYVRDLGSTNGTFVGEQKVEEPTPIRPGETVTIGEVQFEAKYDLADGAILPPVTADAGADTVRKVGSEATFRARPAAQPSPTADDLPPATDESLTETQDSDEFQLMPLDEDKTTQETKVDEDFDPTAWLNEPDDDSKPPAAKPKSPADKKSPKKPADDDDLDDFLKNLE